MSATSLRFRRWLVFGAVMIAGAGRALSAETPDHTGLVIGQKAPPFTLKGQDGQEHSLESLLKKGQAVLVFHRSADW